MAGKINAYQCERCWGIIYTVDRDEGHTPFMIRCRATAGCRGLMQSCFYADNLQDRGIRASHEWYKPTGDQLDGLTVAEVDHVNQGGLVLRPIERRPHGQAQGPQPV